MNYSVNVIWHNDKVVQCDAFKMERDFIPVYLCKKSGGSGDEKSIADLTEVVVHVVSADGDKIETV